MGVTVLCVHVRVHPRHTPEAGGDTVRSLSAFVAVWLPIRTCWQRT